MYKVGGVGSDRDMNKRPANIWSSSILHSHRRLQKRRFVRLSYAPGSDGTRATAGDVVKVTLVVAALLAMLAVSLSLQACGAIVQPGQRELRWYPPTEGLATDTIKSGLY